MDYDHKYIKYKTKYLESKNISEQIGGKKSQKLLLVMFPGLGVPKKGWHVYFDDKKERIEHNFIKELKKIGSIYFYEPNYHNPIFYANDHYKDLYKKNMNFTKADLDIDNICAKIYDDVKDFDGKIILIGHSIGSYFVYYFSQKYSKKCLFGVIIDGSPLGPFQQTKNDKKYLYPKIEKYKSYTDDDIDKLRDKLLKGDKKMIDELLNLSAYNILSHKKTMENAKKFKIPMLCFYNFRISLDNNPKKIKIKIANHLNNKRIKEIEHFKKFNENYKYITFINEGHFPFHGEKSRAIIIDNIKLMCEKYN
jgi:hypothetical protein